MHFRSRLNIKLSLLEENFRKLTALAPEKEVLFMVKADAYGHGMIPIVKFSHEKLGIKEFGVATLEEALKLRKELPHSKFEIYVFSDLQLPITENKEKFKQNRIIPVIATIGDLDYFLGEKDFKHFPLCLKFNTGMNRLGILSKDANFVARKIKDSGRKSIYHLMSHFSSASYPLNNENNQSQLNSFSEVKKVFKDNSIIIEKTSLANSGAIEQGFGLEESHIRPGLILYGPSSLNNENRKLSKWTGKNISSLETYIILTFEVKKGMPIGYGATPCPHDGIMAIIALGYGDGFSTRYQGAHLDHKGHRGIIIGRVNMDMSQILFSLESKEDIRTGENLVIWGNDPREILNFSDETRTIPYEIFCQLTERVPRVYT
jgi:alanine racemase